MNDIQEKNPKQVLIDWVNNVRQSAWRAQEALRGNSKKKEDIASDYIGEILGECKAMEAVLKNSN